MHALEQNALDRPSIASGVDLFLNEAPIAKVLLTVKVKFGGPGARTPGSTARLRRGAWLDVSRPRRVRPALARAMRASAGA